MYSHLNVKKKKNPLLGRTELVHTFCDFVFPICEGGAFLITRKSWKLGG